MRAKFIIALCGLVCTSGVNAQKRTEMNTGSLIPIPERARIPEQSGLSADDRGRVAMAAFARCTVDRKVSRLPRLLSLSANQMTSKLWAELADDECLAGGTMIFQPLILRGALFTELYRRREQAVHLGKTWTLPAVAFDRTATDADDSARLTTALLAFAECVVAHDRIDAEAMIIAPTATLAQNTAIVALKPHLGPCLPQGQTIKLSKTILEGAIGEIMYRGVLEPASQVPAELK